MGEQEAKHTPGPWRIEKTGKRGGYSDYAAISTVAETGKDHWYDLAHVAVVVDGVTDKAGEANARLIAAAPDLLEALEGIADFLEPDRINPSRIRRVHEAIAKARAA